MLLQFPLSHYNGNLRPAPHNQYRSIKIIVLVLRRNKNTEKNVLNQTGFSVRIHNTFDYDDDIPIYIFHRILLRRRSSSSSSFWFSLFYLLLANHVKFFGSFCSVSLLSVSFYYFTIVAFFFAVEFVVWVVFGIGITPKILPFGVVLLCSNMFCAMRCVLVPRITISPATLATCYNFESVCDSCTCTYAERMRRKTVAKWNEMLCAMRCGRWYSN